MINKIEFTKKGVKFVFRKLKIDEYGELVMEYKIPGHDENTRTETDGFFGGAKYLPRLNAIKFLTRKKINGKEVDGVEIPHTHKNKVKELYNEMKAEREEKINIIVDKLIKGEKPIEFSIVGCDFSHYQPWISISESLKGTEQKIMEKATKKILKDELGETTIGAVTICEYLEERLNQDVGTKERINKKAFDFKYDIKTQNYYGYTNKVVTNFSMKLRDIINVEELIEKKRKKENEIKEREKKANKELEKAIEEEFFIFGTDTLSAAGNRLLHSLGCEISDKIEIYTTGMVKYMKKANIEYNDTYKIKELLKNKGFEWNKNKKVWEIDNTKENQKKIINILKQYDTKVNPYELGLVKCWECGSWKYPSQLDENGYCGC